MALQRAQYEETARRFLSLLEQKNIDEWIELYAEDGANHFPFHSGVFSPPDIYGKQQVYAGWRDWPEGYESVSLTVHAIYVDEVARTVTILLDAHNVRTGGAVYDSAFVCLLGFNQDGKITDYYEYFNPLVTGVVFGRIDVTVRPVAD
jgi:ketosteroid isomerase-like protein